MVGAWRHPAARTKPASSLRLRELSKAKLAVLQPRWREQHHEGARGAGRYAFGLLQAGDSQLNRSNFWDAPTLDVDPRLGHHEDRTPTHGYEATRRDGSCTNVGVPRLIFCDGVDHARLGLGLLG